MRFTKCMLYTFLVTALIIGAYWGMAFDEARAQELDRAVG